MLVFLSGRGADGEDSNLSSDQGCSRRSWARVGVLPTSCFQTAALRRTGTTGRAADGARMSCRSSFLPRSPVSTPTRGASRSAACRWVGLARSTSHGCTRAGSAPSARTRPRSGSAAPTPPPERSTTARTSPVTTRSASLPGAIPTVRPRSGWMSEPTTRSARPTRRSRANCEPAGRGSSFTCGQAPRRRLLALPLAKPSQPLFHAPPPLRYVSGVAMRVRADSRPTRRQAAASTPYRRA
jgi:hypothetical protein